MFGSLGLIGLIGLFFLYLVYAQRRLLQIAVRSIWRRKATAFFVIFGALAGTAMFSASFVLGDTMRHSIRQEVYNRLGGLDETVNVAGVSQDISLFEPEALQRMFFPAELATYVAAETGDLTDAVEPALIAFMAAERQATDGTTRAAPQVSVMGVDPTGFAPLTGGDDFPPLEAGDAVLTRALADELGVAPGDSFSLMLWGEGRSFRVTAILDNSRLPSLSFESHAVVINIESVYELIRSFQSIGDLLPAVFQAELAADSPVLAMLGETVRLLQNLVGSPVNALLVSNAGDADTGYGNSDAVVRRIQAGIDAFRADHPEFAETEFMVEPVKQLGLAAADEAGQAFTLIFIVMSGFTVAGGVVLIVNIFVMLIEERKAEIGALRALGMRRGKLAILLITEGLIYALVAGALGALVGGFAATGVISFVSAFIRDLGVVNGMLDISVRIQPTSIFYAFSLGVLVTGASIAYASIRLSRMNIIWAIRDMRSPKLRRFSVRSGIWSGLLILVGAVLGWIGFSADPAGSALALLGPLAALLGLAYLLSYRLPQRAVYTSASLLTFAYVMLLPTQIDGYFDTPVVFILSGLLLLLSTVLFVVFNGRIVLWPVQRLTAGHPSLAAIGRLVVTYPLSYRFRSGMLMMLFALVIFSVSLIAVLKSIQGNAVRDAIAEETGGYELQLQFNQPVVGLDLEQALADADIVDGALVDRVRVRWQQTLSLPDTETFLSLTAVEEGYFADNAAPELAQRAAAYDTDAAAWEAVAEGGNRVILPGRHATQTDIAAGDTLRLCLPETERCMEAVVAGIMPEDAYEGFVLIDTLERGLETTRYQMHADYAIDVSDGADPALVAEQVEQAFARYGVEVQNVEGLAQQAMRLFSVFFTLLEVYLGVGVVVGVSGLAITMIRTVQERRYTIAMLRAIGFRRWQVLTSLLTETGIIAGLGVVIGMSLGILTSWLLFREELQSGVGAPVEFAIPWGELGVIIGACVALSLAACFWPARQASQLAPADVLRKQE
jgi:putative ABC transport system permease protein